MKRKFKFRIWHHGFKRFLSTEEWLIGFGGKIFFIEIHGAGISLIECKENFTIQQFTGEYDSYGSGIYEGDVLLYSFKPDEHGDREQHSGEVYFEAGQFLIDKSFEFSFPEIKLENREVVGNIFVDRRKKKHRISRNENIRRRK